MESPKPKKGDDKCDKINSGTTEDKTIFNLEDEIELRFDDKETMDTQTNDKCNKINSDATEDKRNDKWEEIDSFKSEENDTFEPADDKEIFEDKESVQTQRNDNLDFELELCDSENIGQNGNEMTDTINDENKADALESIGRNLNLDVLEKWMVKIFPPKKFGIPGRKLSNYSEDDNISNDATYARLIIIFIFITVVLCFITFGQLIWILVLSRGPIVVQPFIPKINNPFCK